MSVEDNTCVICDGHPLPPRLREALAAHRWERTDTSAACPYRCANLAFDCRCRLLNQRKSVREQPPGLRSRLKVEAFGPDRHGCLLYLLFRQDPKEHAVKEGIHPKYHDVDARCACGATWKTRSTKPELHLEICSNCHPFFTGKQKLLDTEGRIVRFTKKFGVQTSESRKQAAKAKKETPAPAR